MKTKKVISLVMAGLIAGGTLFSGVSHATSKLPEKGIKLGNPSGILETIDGNLLITDTYNKVVWVVKDGKPEILAGRSEVQDIYGEPIGGYADGTALTAYFQSPWGIAPYLDGYAITDSENNAVRFTDGKDLHTVSGDIEAKTGSSDGLGSTASFNHPTGIVADDKGNVYVADTGNSTIRKINKEGEVTTFIDKGSFFEPTGLLWANDVLYVADSGNHRICKVENGKVSVVAGAKPVPLDDEEYLDGGYLDGSSEKALFDSPQGLEITENGIIYVADTGNSAIRKIENGIVSTVLKLSGDTALYPASPRGLSLIGTTLYVTDHFSGIVFHLSTTEKDFPFDDVKESDWYSSAVSFVATSKLFSGTTTNTFSPEASMNRAMFTTVLSRLEKNTFPNTVIGGEHSFTDIVDNFYYENAVAWAATNKIVLGTGELFLPENAITREDIVTILYKYAETRGYNTAEEGSLENFADAGDVYPYALSPMGWAVENEIIRGEYGRLNPKNTGTRAEAAQIFMNFYNAFIL